MVGCKSGMKYTSCRRFIFIVFLCTVYLTLSLLFACFVICHAFVVHADFFIINFFKQFHEHYQSVNVLDPDRDRCTLGHDWGSNCLQMLLSKRQKVLLARKELFSHQIGISVLFTHVRYPYQPMGKIKKEQPHAGRTSFRDVIVMLK